MNSEHEHEAKRKRAEHWMDNGTLPRENVGAHPPDLFAADVLELLDEVEKAKRRIKKLDDLLAGKFKFEKGAVLELLDELKETEEGQVCPRCMQSHSGQARLDR